MCPWAAASGGGFVVGSDFKRRVAVATKGTRDLMRQMGEVGLTADDRGQLSAELRRGTEIRSGLSRTSWTVVL